MSNMTLEVILKLVDQLTAPARAAGKSLGEFADAAEKLGGGAPKPDGWVQQQKEIDKATGKVEDYKGAIGGVSEVIGQATQAILGFVAAHAGLELAGKVVTAGADAVHLRVGMQAAGMSAAEIADAEAHAAEWSKKYPMLSQTEIEGIIFDTRSIVGTTKEALEVAPKELGYMVADRMAHPGEPGSAGAVLKAAEVMGLTQDEAKLGEFFDRAAQAVNVFARTLRGEDIREFALRSGSQYASKMDLDYFFGPALTAMQEMGGDTAGFSQRMTLQELFGAHLSGREVKALDELGLIDPSKVTRRDKDGHPTEIDPGGIRGTELALTNLYGWVQTVLKPAMEKLSPTEAAEKVATIFANRGSNLVSIYEQQQARIEKDTALRQGAMGAQPTADLWVNKDPGAAGQALVSQFVNWLRSAGEPIMPAAGDAARSAREAIQAEVEATKGHEWINTAIAGATSAAAILAGYMTWTKGASWLSPLGEGLSAIAKAVPMLDLAAIASYTSPDEQKILDAAIAREKAAAEAPPGPVYPGSLDPTSYENRIKAKRALRGAGYWPDDPDAQKEEARELARGRALSGEASPKIDTSDIDKASAKAKEAGDDLKALGATVAPKVDSQRDRRAAVEAARGAIRGRFDQWRPFHGLAARELRRRAA